MNNLAVLERQELAAPTVTDDQLDLIRRTVANGATADELKLYLYDCARQGVHPLDKLIHFTKRGGKYTPVTSIDFMRIRAAETGEMAGSDLPRYDGAPQSPEFVARVTVYRLTQGQRFAYEGEAYWSEYKPDQDFMWRKMPHVMLAKCAEAVALRKGFPKQLAGLYAKEEMDQSESGSPAPISITERMHDSRTGDQSAPPASAGESPEPFDRETGEIVEALPPGFHRITNYRLNGQWHEARLVNWDSQGGSLAISTKLAHIGQALEQAFHDGVAINADVTMKRNTKGEAYLNKFTRLDARRADESHGEPVDASDIPF